MKSNDIVSHDFLILQLFFSYCERSSEYQSFSRRGEVSALHEQRVSLRVYRVTDFLPNDLIFNFFLHNENK